MSETPNCKLHLTDDSGERFQDWRNKMNGTDNSNMVKIDNAIGEKANRSVQFFGVLAVANWYGDESPYTQEINIEGLGAAQNGDIGVSQSATFEQRQAAREAVLNLVEQSEGKLTVVADGTLPLVDIPFVVTLLG